MPSQRDALRAHAHIDAARQAKVAKVVAVLDAQRRAWPGVRPWAGVLVDLLPDDLTAGGLASLIVGEAPVPPITRAAVALAAVQAGVTTGVSDATVRLVLAHINAAAEAEVDPFAGIPAEARR